MMKELGWRGLALLAALAMASPAVVHAQDTGGGGNTGAGGSNDNDAGDADDGGPTGSVGGAGVGPGGTSGGTGAGYDSPGAVSPNDDSPSNSPCPAGYVLSTDADNVCIQQ